MAQEGVHIFQGRMLGTVVLQRCLSSSLSALISRENTQRNLRKCCFNPVLSQPSTGRPPASVWLMKSITYN